MEQDLTKKAARAMSEGKYPEAARLFDEAFLEDKEHDRNTHFNYAICLCRTKRFAEAARRYEAFLAMTPDEETPQFLEFIDCLKRAGEVPLDEGQRLFDQFTQNQQAQQQATTIGGREFTLQKILAAWELIEKKTKEERVDSLRGITGTLPHRVASNLFACLLLEQIGFFEVHELCCQLQRAGCHLAIALQIAANIEPNQTAPDTPTKAWTRAALSRRVPWSWYFIETALDNVVTLAAEKILRANPTLTPFSERFKKEVAETFVYEGFSYGLEGYGY